MDCTSRIAAVLGLYKLSNSSRVNEKPGSQVSRIRSCKSGNDGLEHVILVHRREGNYFTSALYQRLHGVHHSFGCAASDHDVPVGVRRNAVETLQLVRDGTPQRGSARWIGVLVIAAGDRLSCELLEFSRRVIVWESLR